MKRDDVIKLFKLLNALHPKSPHPERDENKISAWYLALKPYEYSAIGKAVLVRSRLSRFYPDNVAEILEYIAKPQVSPPAPSTDGYGWKSENDLLRMQGAWKTFCDRLDSAGLPRPPRESTARAGWEASVLAAGINLDWIGEAFTA